MQKRQRNYVRLCRRASALTHEELARLIGQRSDSAISQYESGQRLPTLRAALALEVVFGKSPSFLFPGTYSAIEEEVMLRAAKVERALAEKNDRKSAAKRQHLNDMSKRSRGNADGL